MCADAGANSVLVYVPAACSYSLHNCGWKYRHAKDQTQAVVVYLLNVTTRALSCSSNLVQHCRQHTALHICKQYRSPMQRLVRLFKSFGLHLTVCLLYRW